MASTLTTGLPPGPRLPRYLQSVLYLRFREWFLPAIHRKYGDVFSLRVPPYADNLVVYTRPEHIKEIFAADPRSLHAGEGNHILGFVMGEHSVLMTDEAEHARMRSLLMPAFTRAALRGYRDMIASVAREHITRWRPHATINSLDHMNALTLDIILRVVFGVTDPKVKAELTSRLQQIINIHPAILAGVPYPSLKRMNPWKRFFHNQTKIDEILYREIASRRIDSDLTARTDVLSRLLQTKDTPTKPLTDAELRDQLITLLLAGHETTAAALSWTLWELAHAPEIQSQVVWAAVGGDDGFLRPSSRKECADTPSSLLPLARSPRRQRSVVGDCQRGRWSTRRSCWPTPARYRTPNPQSFVLAGSLTAAWHPTPGCHSAAVCADASASGSPSPRERSSCKRFSAASPSPPPARPKARLRWCATSPPSPNTVHTCG